MWAGGDPEPSVESRTELAQMESPAAASDRPADLEREKARNRFRYLMLGYGLIWVSLGAYLIGMNRRVAAVGREIEELKVRLQDAERTTGGSGR